MGTLRYCINEVRRRTRDYLDQYPLTFLSLLLVLYLLLFVPQIREIWCEAPLQLTQKGWRPHWFLVIFLFAFYAHAWLEVVHGPFQRSMRSGTPSVCSEPSNTSLFRHPLRKAIDVYRAIRSAFLVADGLLYNWPVALAQRSPLARRVGCLVMCTLGLVFLGVSGILADPDSGRVIGIPLVDLAFRAFGGLFISAAVWLIVAAWRGADPKRLREGLFGVSGRLIAAAIATYVAGECLWVAAHWSWFHTGTGLRTSYRLYSLWAIFQTCFLLLGFSSAVDVWHRKSQWPVRQICTLVIVVWALNLQPDTVGEHLEYVARPADWYEALWSRLDSTHPDAPLILVAASGGGSRAAYFSALVYEVLNNQPLKTYDGRDIGDGPRTWADQLVLISSVSGGSLATAYFAHNLAWTEHSVSDSDVGLRNSYKETLARRAIDLLFNERDKRDPDGSDANRITLAELYEHVWENTWKKTQATPDVQQADWAHYGKAIELLKGLRQQGNLPSWVLNSRFGDDMCTDFMAPLLRGVLTPSQERGIALSRFWEQRFGWQASDTIRGYSGSNYCGESSGRTPPLVMFNATNARLGTRIVIGFPPLPGDTFLVGHQHHHPQDHEPDRAEYHALPLSHYDWQYKVSLAEAARISANFPWGTRTARLRVKRPQPHSAAMDSPSGSHDGMDSPLDLLDGGVEDNSGIRSLWRIVKHLVDASNDPVAYARTVGLTAAPGGAGPLIAAMDLTSSDSGLARRILDRIRRQGVLFLEIDSGAKPSTNVQGELRTPMQALANGNYADELALRKWLIRDLGNMLRPDEPTKELQALAKRSAGYMARHTFVCNHSGRGDVLTTWTLAPEDKAKIMATFLCEYYQWSEIELHTTFRDWLKAWEGQRKQPRTRRGRDTKEDIKSESPACIIRDEAREKLRMGTMGADLK
jgi:hypothetical protein